MDYIRGPLAEEVLPIHMDNGDDPDYQWKSYPQVNSVFKLGPRNDIDSEKRGSKRSRDDDDSQSRSSKKRKARCRFKNDCRKLRSGGCSYVHTRSEIANAKKQYNAQNGGKYTSSKSDNSKSKEICNNFLRGHCRRGNDCPRIHPKNPKRSENRRQGGSRNNKNHKDPCSRGESCFYWQKGECYYHHNKWKMKCGHCGKPGHPRCLCRSLNQNQTATPPHYDLMTQQANHQGVQPHNAMMLNPSNQQAFYTQSFVPRTVQVQQQAPPPSQAPSNPAATGFTITRSDVKKVQAASNAITQIYNKTRGMRFEKTL